MKFRAWVKFADDAPMVWVRENFEMFWHDLNDYMLRYKLKLEWIIVE